MRPGAEVTLAVSAAVTIRMAGFMNAFLAFHHGNFRSRGKIGKRVWPADPPCLNASSMGGVRTAHYHNSAPSNAAGREPATGNNKCPGRGGKNRDWGARNNTRPRRNRGRNSGRGLSRWARLPPARDRSRNWIK